MIATSRESNNQSEPTTRELMVTIQELTQAMCEGFERMDQKFERVDGVLSTLQIGQDNLLVEVHDIKRRVVHLEFQMADVQDSLNDLSEAEAKDAMASINHEQRIVRLEKINNIQAVSPEYLTEIE